MFVLKIDTIHNLNIREEINSGEVANVLDSGILLNVFKLRSCYYVYFQINTLEKNINPFGSKL